MTAPTVHVVGPSSPHHDWLRSCEPANECPPPDPGFRASNGLVTYTTARGQVYVVRDGAGRICLQPVELDVATETDEIEDSQLLIVAEAADALDAEIGDGWWALRFALFVRHLGDTWLIYAKGDEYASVRVAEVPAAAVRLDVIPDAALLHFDSLVSRPATGGDHG